LGDAKVILFKILAAWTVISIIVGLGISPIIRWCMHYEPPQMPPLPSGSLRDHDGLTS
jgi:hypothetical protein